MHPEYHSLTDMPAIGKDAAEKLTAAGIDTPEKLLTAGTEEAFIRIRTVDPGACISRLYGLECAVTGVPRGSLTQERKAELRAFHKTLEGK